MLDTIEGTINEVQDTIRTQREVLMTTMELLGLPMPPEKGVEAGLSAGGTRLQNINGRIQETMQMIDSNNILVRMIRDGLMINPDAPMVGAQEAVGSGRVVGGNYPTQTGL